MNVQHTYYTGVRSTLYYNFESLVWLTNPLLCGLESLNSSKTYQLDEKQWSSFHTWVKQPLFRSSPA
jgi:hypothetical protein